MTIDAYSETWVTVKERINTIIDAARGRLEQIDQSHDKSQFERGRIAACREILGMTTPPKSVPDFSKTPEDKRPRDRSGI